MWLTRWQRQVELSQFDDLISYKGDVAVARRAFVNWKYCILALTLINLIDRVNNISFLDLGDKSKASNQLHAGHKSHLKIMGVLVVP